MVEPHGRRQREEMGSNYWEWGWEEAHQGTNCLWSKEKKHKRREKRGKREKMRTQKINVSIVSLDVTN